MNYKGGPTPSHQPARPIAADHPQLQTHSCITHPCRPPTRLPGAHMMIAQIKADIKCNTNQVYKSKKQRAPDCTRSSTMTTCRPRGVPSFSLTIRLSPSRTLVQITCLLEGGRGEERWEGGGKRGQRGQEEGRGEWPRCRVSPTWPPQALHTSPVAAALPPQHNRPTAGFPGFFHLCLVATNTTLSPPPPPPPQTPPTLHLLPLGSPQTGSGSASRRPHPGMQW